MSFNKFLALNLSSSVPTLYYTRLTSNSLPLYRVYKHVTLSHILLSRMATAYENRIDVYTAKTTTRRKK